MEQSLLKDIGSYKNRIISKFLKSSEIMELLLGEGYTDEDVHGSGDDNYGVVYNNIFPYLYVEELQTEVKSYLCIEVYVPKVPTYTIKDMKIIIWAYCHKNCMPYSKKGYLGTRADILADMVESELRDMDNLGIGKLELDSVSYIFPNSSYYGREMIFSMPDFKVKQR